MIGRLFRMTVYQLTAAFVTAAGYLVGGLSFTDALIVGYGVAIIGALQGEDYWKELFGGDDS